MNNPETRQSVLIVDDAPDNIRLLGYALSGDYQVHFATRGQEALERAFASPPDLILLDVMMPGMDGFQVCETLCRDERTRDVPVILVTALHDMDAEIRGFNAGAVDFVNKPVNPLRVRARVAVQLALKRQRDALASANARLQEEIACRQHLEAQLREQAEFDNLTGLPNRKLFQDRLEQVILAAQRHRQMFALMFVDLDRFKWVNDTLGHDAGDALLVEASRRLKGVVRKSDTVARLGGDEFTVILSDILHESMAELVARKILEQLALPFLLKGQEVVISGSCGIALFPGDGAAADELTRNADSAMYRAKESGRNAFQFFSREINQLAQRRLRLEVEMRRACLMNEFYLDYQPKVTLASGQMTGMEALVRWDHPREGILLPQQFIPLAEGTGLIAQLGAWVLRTACLDAASWAMAGYPDLRLAVNLSALQFRDGDSLVRLVQEVLQETGFPGDKLELEITENMMLGDPKKAVETLNRLREMGVGIAMDDFGTGYSSLALLRQLPIQVIKIDRSFVQDLGPEANDAVFLSAMLSMARKLGLHVVVEGVENLEQLAFLQNQDGGDEVQGYFFSPPLGREAFSALLQGKIPLGGGGIYH
ncbi:MAG: EAL domain-containing protein [Magnetococcales bacterium]|nr:EAL domain-containing protein [Magnetococcales bacterium]